MLTPPHSKGNSPHDSLSPLDDGAMYEFKEQCKRFSFEGYPNEESVSAGEETQQEPHFTCLDSQTQHEVAADQRSTGACSPRSTLILRNQRPSDLKLTKTNGWTALSLSELRQRIGDARTDNDATTVQIPRPKANHLPETPATPSPLIMGNKPSSIAGSPVPDNASVRSVVRKPVQILRKSSTNLFKRIDSQTPIPSKLTGTVIHVQQQVSPVSFDGVDEESDEVARDPEIVSNPLLDQIQDVVPPHSVSTDTVTNVNPGHPISASNRTRDVNIDGHSEFKADSRSPCKERKVETNLQQKQALARQAALSPSIPAPSPLPEDSPHKYGLKDRTDTPDMPEPEDINVVKARRRSSGIEVFNEAKSLQSASSFLNGLSTSRRRAESAQPGNEVPTWSAASQDTTRPYSARLQSRPTSKLQTTYSSERCRGHNFKPSGFAYSRPLTMAQIKCYRSHARMMLSHNKKAPVECSVCHIDDDNDHYSCSWCAIRMCRFCRKDFAERGMMALKQRIKQAELGNPSPSSSSDSLGGLGPARKSYT